MALQFRIFWSIHPCVVLIPKLVIVRRPTWRWRVEISSVCRGRSTREAAPPRISCDAPWTHALHLHQKEAPIPVCRPFWSSWMQRLGAACCCYLHRAERGYPGREITELCTRCPVLHIASLQKTSLQEDKTKQGGLQNSLYRMKPA